MPSQSFASALGCISLMLVAQIAAAQEMPVPENVTIRARPEGDALGVPLGAFRAYPKLGVFGGYDDNILATDSNELAAFRLTLAPSALVESQWSRHSFSIASFLESRLYEKHSKQDYLEWGVGAKGRLDILDSTHFSGSSNYQHLTEERSGIDVVSVAPEPSNYNQFDVSGVFNHRFDQLALSVASSFADLKYKTDDQEYRDRDIIRSVGQLGYAFSPGYSAFIRGTFNSRDYRNRSTVTLGNPKQNSLGYQIVGGVSSQLTNLIAGEAYLGYLDQNYESSSFEDVNGVSFGVNLTWFATGLTTVQAKASREVVDSTVGGAGGILYLTAGLGIEHELTRDIRLRGDIGYYQGDYEGIPRNDDGVRASAGITYILTRHVHIEARYNFDNRYSNVPGQDFNRSQIDLGFELQL